MVAALARAIVRLSSASSTLPALALPPLRTPRALINSLAADDPSFSSPSISRDDLDRRLSSLAADAASTPPLAMTQQLNELASKYLLAIDASDVESMMVADLKAALSARSLSAKGLKAELKERLLAALPDLPPTSPSPPEPIKPAASASPPDGGGGDKLMPSLPFDAQLAATLASVAQQHANSGPQDGIFCDGSCSPNPGPGGWGVVAVKYASIEWTAHNGVTTGETTNNRMELSAIIAALERLPFDTQRTIYSDSNLCVRSLNEWAPGWEKKGWRKANGKKVENEDLVRQAYGLYRSRPNVKLVWLKGHAGGTWNEVADALAGAWARR